MNKDVLEKEEKSSSNDAIIEMIGVHKWFDDFHVLKDINITIRKQERIVICGPSGSGKSTLIRCINHLEQHQRGQIIVDGIEMTNDLKNIEKIRAEVGMVFQQFNLFPHLTIVENLTLGPIWARKIPKAEAEETAMYFLEKVHIPEQAHKYPGQLSGGQQQRVAIARSLCMNPKVMLFDEPTTGLAPLIVNNIANITKTIHKEGTTIFLVEQNALMATSLSDYYYILRDGQVVSKGSTDSLPENKKDFFSKYYI